MRVCALLGTLGALSACGGSALEHQERAVGGSGGRDAGGESGSGGSAGVIIIDPGVRDSSLSDDLPGSCATGVSLPIENEDGGSGCSIPLPEFAEQYRNRINVEFEQEDGGTARLYHVRGAQECDSDATTFALGWYYYEDSVGARVGFCPNACTAISSDGDGSVTVVRGCAYPGP